MEHAEIARIQDQFVGNQWPKFFQSVSIDGLRGWSGQEIELHFPVTAIVGENGSGKTTVLKAIACAYDTDGVASTYYPTHFFQSTYWDAVTNVKLSYKIKQGNNYRSYTMSKPSERWSYPDDKARRNVFFLDISRTLPMDATVGYAKIAKIGRAESGTSDLGTDQRNMLSFILGREYQAARFAISDADPNREVGLLTFGGREISQFHQGAGEDATLDFMRVLQSVPDTSLIIIDEVENSLHPKAQRRLMKKLLELSRQKRFQVVVSTHSPYVLDELPPQARILLAREGASIRPIYNVSTEFAMSRIDDDLHPELYIFVEDREAQALLREILAPDTAGRELLQRIQILPVGAANVLQTIGPGLASNRYPYKGVCFLDADESPFAGCRVLPGTEAPEREVFNGLRSIQWSGLDNAFQHGAGELFAWLDDAVLEPDHHRWPTVVGDRLRMSKDVVWQIMCREWVARVLTKEQRTIVLDQIRSDLDQSANLFHGRNRSSSI